MAQKGEYKELNQTQFEILCKTQHGRDEICMILGCSVKTLYGWCRRTYGMTFSKVRDVFNQEGRANVRRKMYEKAMRGDNTMLIWLSKQWCGMKEREESHVEHSGKQDVTFKVQYVNSDR